jgi:hypothetical protein
MHGDSWLQVCEKNEGRVVGGFAYLIKTVEDSLGNIFRWKVDN